MAELIFKEEVYAIVGAAVEIKALDKLTAREEAQLLNYLKATASPLGVLINFGALGRLEWKRMAATQNRLRTNFRPSTKISEN